MPFTLLLISGLCSPLVREVLPGKEEYMKVVVFGCSVGIEVLCVQYRLFLRTFAAQKISDIPSALNYGDSQWSVAYLIPGIDIGSP